MKNQNDILLTKALFTNEELTTMHLRALYKDCGYSLFKSGRFEEYSLYNDHKDFLPPGEIITFTGVNGKLMALRPDVTLSIVRGIDGSKKESTKLYYNENVYRTNNNELREQVQVGLECIGDVGPDAVCEVITLAVKSLEILSYIYMPESQNPESQSPKSQNPESQNPEFRLCISHMGFINGILKGSEGSSASQLTTTQKKQLLKCINQKNIFMLKDLCHEYGLDNDFYKNIKSLTEIYAKVDKAIEQLQVLIINEETKSALDEMIKLREMLMKLDIADNIYLDFTIVNDIGYYSGIIFQGFIKGIPSKVISGGRYDMLLRKLKKDMDAIGFAVYLDFQAASAAADATYAADVVDDAQKPVLNIALPKGRLGDKAYDILKAAGLGCPGLDQKSRKLIFETPDNSVRYFWVKPSDVAVYVERGAADIGIVGKDILLEQSPDIYELLDMGIGKCRICVAAEKDKGILNKNSVIRVVTIFPNIAADYFNKSGRRIEIIKLHGSIEIAPLLKLGDVIVDIVETGKTLQENNLEPVELITDITARLIANKVSYKFKHKEIEKLCTDISKTLEAKIYDKNN